MAIELQNYSGEFAIALGAVFVALGIYRLLANRQPKPRFGFIGVGLIFMVVGLVIELMI